MLQVTSRAASLLKGERSHRGLPEHFGLRVKRASRDDPRGGVRFAFTEGPLEDDAVGETEGLRLFVAGDVADELSDLTIDAHDSADASDLVLRDQGDVQP